MGVRQFVGNVTKAALICACVYAVVKWQTNSAENSDIARFAEEACVDEIGVRYNVSNIRPYDIDENSSGYVVRVAVTSTRGTPAKVVCLTNANGGIRDIMIEER